jgi:hypothetical protein
MIGMVSHRIGCGMYAPQQNTLGHMHLLRSLRIQELQDGNRHRFRDDLCLVGQLCQFGMHVADS